MSTFNSFRAGSPTLDCVAGDIRPAGRLAKDFGSYVAVCLMAAITGTDQSGPATRPAMAAREIPAGRMAARVDPAVYDG